MKHYINSVTFAYIDNLVKHFKSNANDSICTHNVSMSSITDSVPDSVETRDQVDELANLTDDSFRTRVVQVNQLLELKSVTSVSY